MASTEKKKQIVRQRAANTSVAAPRPAERGSLRKASAPKRHRASDPGEFKTSMLNIRVREDLKIDATKALENIGISLPEAVRVFLGRVVREQAFPFSLEVPNAETARALRESITSDRKRFASVEDLFDDLEAGVR